MAFAVLAALLACSGNVTWEDSSAKTTTNSTTGGITDSGTTSGTGTTSSSTTSGAGGGVMSCSELEEAYAADIASALVCNPALDLEQCVFKVPGDLLCQCDIFANPENMGVLGALLGYLDAYKTQQCDPGVDCDCADATSGSCEPDGATGGVCVSKY